MLELLFTKIHLEVLLQTLVTQYLSKSYCVTVVSEVTLNLIFPISFVSIYPNDTDTLSSQLLKALEMGCSDYILQIKDPKSFMNAFEKATVQGNVRRSDKKLIFLPLSEGQDDTQIFSDMLSMKESSYVANILLVLPHFPREIGCESFNLVTHKYVGLDEEVDQPLYLDQWNSCTEEFRDNVNLFPHNMTNLHGKKVRVACFTYKPYVILNQASELQIRDGTEMRIIDEFCRWINCTVEVVNEEKYQWGEIYENGTGVGVIGSVFENRADLGITALYSWFEEWRRLDFSASTIRTAITCVAPSPRLLESWQMPLMPFSWNLWLAVITTFIFASIGLILGQNFSTNNIFLTVFGIMISQSQAGRSSWRVRSFTGWLLLAGLVLDAAYSGGLSSTFTVPNYEPSIDTVKDIVQRKMHWGATHDAWIFSLTMSQEPVVKQLVSQFRTYPEDKLKELSFTRGMAFSIEKLPAGYFAIGDYITKEALLDMTLMLEDFYYEQCVIMMRKNSAFTEKISHLVGRLHQSGLMLAWETQVVLNSMTFKVQLEVKLSRSGSDIGIAQPLSIRRVVGIFILYIAGAILSVAIFFGEILLHRTSKQKRRTLKK